MTRLEEFRRSLGLATLTLLLNAVGVQANKAWLTVPNSSLQVEAGTALDLSDLSKARDPNDTRRVTVPAGSESFAIGGQPDPDQRYFCATMGFGWNTGRLPPIEEASAWAKAVRRGGYNAVRFHMMDLVLMEGRYRDFDFDPVQLERFDHLVAALRAEGISFVFDVMGSWNGAYGDVGKNRWVEGIHDTKAGTYFEGADRDHFVKLVDLLWRRPNPLTGISPLADPATIGLILVNESEVDFITRKGIGRHFVEPFHDWLIARYGSDADITAAWGAPFTADNLKRIDEIGSARRDFQIFATEIQNARVAWMREVLKERGYDGPITDFNTDPGIHSAVSRRSLSFVDMHGYADSPSNGMVEPGAALWSEKWTGDLLDGKSRYFDRLSWSRLEGKPFTVSEYGMSFWNSRRYAVAPMTAAYARLQDWKMACHFGTTIALARPARGIWQQRLVPFNAGQDPTLRAGETIAAFLFGRGDVSASDTRVVFEVPLDTASSAPGSLEVDWASAKLQHLVSVAVGWRGETEGPGPKRLVIPWEENGRGLGSLVEQLRNAGVSLPGTDPSSGILQSSTGELTLDTHAERFTLKTRGTIGLVASGPTAEVQNVGWRLSLIDGEGAVFLSDLGEGDLSRTRRGLLVIATDARNTDMSFRDAAETVLDKIGRFPVQIRDATVQVEPPASSTAFPWRLYALDFTGRRTREIGLQQQSDGRVIADIRLSELGADVTTYFEFTAGSN